MKTNFNTKEAFPSGGRWHAIGVKDEGDKAFMSFLSFKNHQYFFIFRKPHSDNAKKTSVVSTRSKLRNFSQVMDIYIQKAFSWSIAEYH